VLYRLTWCSFPASWCSLTNVLDFGYKTKKKCRVFQSKFSCSVFDNCEVTRCIRYEVIKPRAITSTLTIIAPPSSLYAHPLSPPRANLSSRSLCREVLSRNSRAQCAAPHRHPSIAPTSLDLPHHPHWRDLRPSPQTRFAISIHSYFPGASSIQMWRCGKGTPHLLSTIKSPTYAAPCPLTNWAEGHATHPAIAAHTTPPQEISRFSHELCEGHSVTLSTPCVHRR
jgi:hypothetical protein